MRLTFQAVLLLSLVLSGCAEDEGPSIAPMSYMSYNAGLAHGAVALSAERIPEILTALQAEPVDVLCLQEVWRDADYDRFVSELSSVYPHNFRELTRDESPKTVKCSAQGTNDLNTCVDDNCTPQGISAGECVDTVCKTEYDALTLECKLCLAANTADPFACVLTGARDYTYDGRNGLILFSKHPIDNPTYTPFDTLLVKRGVINAQIQGVNVQCTHMSSDLAPTVPYPEGRDFSDWVSEHAAQIEAIDSTATSGCNVLMGDLNTGPATANLTGEIVDNFASIEAKGYADPFPDATCTWCIENPLTGSSTDRKLDHIMTRGCDGTTTESARAFDQEITVTNKDGDELTTRLSDHYGVTMEMK